MNKTTNLSSICCQLAVSAVIQTVYPLINIYEQIELGVLCVILVVI